MKTATITIKIRVGGSATYEEEIENLLDEYFKQRFEALGSLPCGDEIEDALNNYLTEMEKLGE